MSQDRRRFLQSAAAAAIATRVRPVLGANERVNMAVVGLGGRGRGHVAEFARQPNTRIAAVCDVNQAAQERAVAQVEKLQGHKPKALADMREVFSDKEVDVVSIATPNHWHALATIWACQAGKDVYVEKPACFNIYEGRKMIEAARKYKRMVQVGSQGRSIAHKRRAIELLRQGVIGKLYMAKGLCFKRRRSIGHTPDTAVPPGINWDLFLGPAPMRPFSQNRYAYNWHWFWDTGNGDIGNQGVHEMDYARWGLGDIGLPKAAVSTGGKFVYHDDQETPNTQMVTLDYGDVQLLFEVRGLLTGPEGGIPISGGNCIGNLFYGSDGYMSVDVNGFQVFKGEKHEKVMDEKFTESRGWATDPHIANLLEAVRSRNAAQLNADVEVGVLSADLCHLANIAYRLGRKVNFDPAAMRFISDGEADRMLTRDYRAPFLVPDRV
jgi:predicted dehydrogenase